MFRVDHKHVPNSDIKHISGENLNFAMLLRKPMPAVALKDKKKKKAGEDSLEYKLEQVAKRREKEPQSSSRRSSASMGENDSFKVPKDNGCRNSQCRSVAEETVLEVEERANMKTYTIDLTDSINEELVILNTLTSELQQIMAVQQALVRKMSKFDVEIDGFKQKLQNKKEEQKKLDEMIAAANVTIRRLRERDEHEAQEKLMQQQQQEGQQRQSSKKTRLRRKHNGEFSVLYNGKAQWSCCHAEEEGAVGCIEDHSVGLMETMGNIKNSFRNYSQGQPFVPKQRDPYSEATRQKELIMASQKLTFGTSITEEQHPLADFHHVTGHVPAEHHGSMLKLPRPQSAVAGRPTTLRPLNQRPQSAAPGLPLHRSVSLAEPSSMQVSAAPMASNQHNNHHGHHHHHHHHHGHHHHHHHSQSAGRHRRAHQQHLHLYPHHQHPVPQIVDQQDESFELLQSSSILSHFRDSGLGKQRVQSEGTNLIISKNRPMSSPAGFVLYNQ